MKLLHSAKVGDGLPMEIGGTCLVDITGVPVNTFVSLRHDVVFRE